MASNVDQFMRDYNLSDDTFSMGLQPSEEEQQRSRERMLQLQKAQEVSGIPFGGQKEGPQVFQEAVQSVQMGDDADLYNRLFKYDNEQSEASSRQALERASGFYMARPKMVYDKDNKEINKPELLLDSKVSDTDVYDGKTKSKFVYVPFAKGTSVEQKAGLVARSGGYQLAIPKVDDPSVKFDAYATDENGILRDYIPVKPRYIRDLEKQRTDLTQQSSVEKFLGVNFTPPEIGRGKEKLSRILTEMGIENPAEQVAVLAGEDTGALSRYRGTPAGVRSFKSFVSDAYDFLLGAGKRGMTAIGAFNLPAGGAGTDIAEQQLKLVREVTIANTKAELDAENKGMMFTDEATGIRLFRPEYHNDYVGALVAEGYPREAAEKYWRWNQSVVGDAAFLAGEEAVPMLVGTGLRIGMAVLGSLNFVKHIKTVTGADSVDDAIKQGYTPAQLFNSYMLSKEGGGGWLNRINQTTILNSARLLGNRFGGRLDVKAAEDARVRVKDAWAALQGKKNELAVARLKSPEKVARIQGELDRARDTYKGAQAYADNLTETAFKDSWIYDTLKTSTYGIASAAVISNMTEEYLGEDFAPFGEIGGYIAGNTIASVAGRGFNGLMKFAGMKTDAMLDILETNFGIGTFGLRFEKMGVYDDFDKLPKSQQEIIKNLSILGGTKLAGLRANASFVNDLRDRLGSITDQNGRPIFDESFLDTTIAVVTGLNILRVAEQQLAKKISVGEINNFDENFYLQETFLSKNSELLQRLNLALAQLTPVKGNDPMLDQFVSGLTKYSEDMKEVVAQKGAYVLQDLQERQSIIRGALMGDKDSWAFLGVDNYEQLPQRLNDLFMKDDELFIQAHKYLGTDPQKVLAEFDTMLKERNEFIRTTAESMSHVIGGGQSMYDDGPSRLMLASLTSISSGNYNKAGALYSLVPDNVFMDGTRIYDHVKNIGSEVSKGAQKEGGEALRGLSNYRDQFKTAAERSLKERLQMDDAELQEIANQVGAKKGDYLDLWERLRALGQGETLGFSEKKLDKINETFGGSLEELGALDLPINIDEFQDIQSGIKTRVRNLFGRQQTGRGTVQDRELYEELHEIATDETFGFMHNYFDEDSMAPASDAYDALEAANRFFRENYAERYLRGNVYPGVLKGRNPTEQAIVDSVELPGVMEAHKVLNSILGDMATAQKALDADNLRSTQKTLNMGFGTRIPEGGITVKTIYGEQYKQPGEFVLMEGEDADTLRSILEMKLAEEVWKLPGMSYIRNKMLLDKPVNAMGLPQQIRNYINSGDADISPDLIDNYSKITVLRQNKDGTYTEVPLINMENVYEKLSLGALMKADEKTRKQVFEVNSTLQTTLEGMKAASKARTNARTNEYETLRRAAESLGSDPNGFFNTYFDKGFRGFGEMSEVKKGIAQKAREDGLELAQKNNLTGADADEFVEEYIASTMDEFRILERDHYGRWLKSKTVGVSEDVVALTDPTTLKSTPTAVHGFKSGELLRMLGADAGPDAVRNRQAFLDLFDGDEEHYDKLVALGEWGMLQLKKQGNGGVVVDGIAQGLSVESWISRIYSINRGVVSPRYVAAEALIQSLRQQGVSVLELMVADKNFARLAMKILSSDKPLPTDKENIQFVQTGVVALSMVLQRYGYAEEEIRERLSIIRVDTQERGDELTVSP